MKLPRIFLVVFLLGLISAPASDDWMRAVEPRAWLFPRDHGAHPEFKTEWWYFTGNLENEQKQPYGYQFTIFRQGVIRDPQQKRSAWAMRDFFFGHFTVSDLTRSKFYFAEKVARPALGLAGASTENMTVWLQDWRIDPVAPESYRLRAQAGDRAIDLLLTPSKPLVLQGDRGLSQKAVGLGNASHYYSYPRLQTQGTLTLQGQTHRLTGQSWFDHEFSTSALGPQQVGWDWFSLQFDQGAELMLYGMRNRDGTFDLTSRGAWLSADGKKHDLLAQDFTIQATAWWQSPATKGRYPARWNLLIPKLGLSLEVEPRLADQELRLKELGDLSYWEGSCRVTGTEAGKKINGVGYVELTGYAKPLGSGMKE